MQAAISGFSASRHAMGPETSGPMTPVVWLMITPGQAARMASLQALATSGSHDGKCP